MKNLIYLITLKPTSHRTAEESLGIQYLGASLAQENYEVKIRDAWLNDDLNPDIIFDEIIKDKNKLLFVGTSSYMLNNEPTINLIKKLVDNDINVVCGGYGPTFEPEQFLEAGAKLVMVGEGEKSIIKVAEYFSEKIKLGIEQIPSILYYKDNVLTKSIAEPICSNLDELPFPLRPYLDIVKSRHSTINVSSSRGCLGACLFCSISAFLKKQKSVRWRGRSIPNIIEELKYLQSQGATTIKFIDDSFLENERDDEWCENFRDELRKNNINLNFRASIRADKVTSKNMKMLSEAGFFSFSCGIENGAPTALKRMAKKASVQDNEIALQIFKDNNIYVQAGFILFDNKTTLDELKQNYEFLKKHIWLVSKGIFSEMFAAAGTVFTETLSPNDKSIAANYSYVIEDEKSRKIHYYLKKWQAHHSKVYDMVIDPVSAPKDIPVPEMKKYHELMVQMKEIDLEFMKECLDAVEENKDLENIYSSFYNKYNNVFNDIQKIAYEYYLSDNLTYDAGTNSFLFTKTNIEKV